MFPKHIRELQKRFSVPDQSCGEVNCSELILLEDQLGREDDQGGKPRRAGAPGVRKAGHALSPPEKKNSDGTQARRGGATSCFCCHAPSHGYLGTGAHLTVKIGRSLDHNEIIPPRTPRSYSYPPNFENSQDFIGACHQVFDLT